MVGVPRGDRALPLPRAVGALTVLRVLTVGWNAIPSSFLPFPHIVPPRQILILFGKSTTHATECSVHLDTSAEYSSRWYVHICILCSRVENRGGMTKQSKTRRICNERNERVSTLVEKQENIHSRPRQRNGRTSPLDYGVSVASLHFGSISRAMVPDLISTSLGILTEE